LINSNFAFVNNYKNDQQKSLLFDFII